MPVNERAYYPNSDIPMSDRASLGLGGQIDMDAGGVACRDMRFCGEPTADFDAAGEYLRVWYEANRETWWDRHPRSRNQAYLRAGAADSFMLGLINEVGRIETERERQVAAMNPPLDHA